MAQDPGFGSSSASAPRSSGVMARLTLSALTQRFLDEATRLGFTHHQALEQVRKQVGE